MMCSSGFVVEADLLRVGSGQVRKISGRVGMGHKKVTHVQLWVEVIFSYNGPNGEMSLLQQPRCTQANTPAARYWLRLLLGDGRRQD